MENKRNKEKEILARYLKENDYKAFIIDNIGNWYFCDILSVSESIVHVFNFAGKRKGEESIIPLSTVKDIKLYKEKNGA
jgi:hypothetical protein